MIRLLLIFLFSFIMLFDIIAQQDPQYSQYMYNHLIVNPGYAGSNEAICLNAVHRQQWVGIDGAPVTSVFSANSPFNIKIKEKTTTHGFGLTVMSDQIGFDQNVSAGLSYAFRLPLGSGKLGIGVSGLFLNKGFRKDAAWRIPSSGTPPDLDLAIPSLSGPPATGLDMGIGVFYRADNVYMGISSTHLLEPTLSYERANYRLKRHIYATAGCLLPLGNPAWEASPSLMAYSDGTAHQLTANINLTYNKKVWGGLGYRLNDAVIAMIGFDLFNGVKIGYAFDYTYTNLRTHFTAGGSHEVIVSYCFNLVKDKVVKKYKSVRFL